MNQESPGFSRGECQERIVHHRRTQMYAPSWSFASGWGKLALTVALKGTYGSARHNGEVHRG